MIYCIIGASLTGKSSIRKHITATRGISGIDTDTLRTLANALRPDLKVGHDCSMIENYNGMRQVIVSFLDARSYFAEDYILEGDCININDIATEVENHTLKAIVLGYPRATTQQVIRNFRSTAATHWSAQLTDRQLAIKAKDFILFSQHLKDETQRLGITYIDNSDQNDNSKIISQVEKILFEVG